MATPQPGVAADFPRLEVVMAWRKWFVRSVVFAVIGSCIGIGWVYQLWTNPGAVRSQVIAKLQKMYPGATVAVDSARLRILGGISLGETRLGRRDDPDRSEFAYVPAAILYHDKEKLLDGVLNFRKVELYRPRLRIVRGRDGCWNLEGVAGPLQPDVPLPTVIIHQGTLVLEDQQAGPTSPLLEIHDVNLTLLNDPLPCVTFEGSAAAALGGTLRLSGTWKRAPRTELGLTLSATGLPLSSALLEPLLRCCAQQDLKEVQLAGQADLQLELAYQPATQPAISHEVRCQLRKATIQHPLLPFPLEEVEACLRCSNGEIKLDQGRARAGPARIEAEGTAWLPCPQLDFKGSVKIEHLPLSNELLPKLPEKLRQLCWHFQPSGQATVRLDCARRQGQWTALASGAAPRVVLQPENMQVCFRGFPYPLDNFAGALEMNLLTNQVRIAATARASGQPVTLKGSWQGSGIEADASFDIQVADLPLDKKLIEALPADLQKLARSFQPHGLGDVKAHIRHLPGTAGFANDYHLRFHDCTVQWDDFPYPLSQVSGYLDIYPKYWEFRDFQGQHHGGSVKVQGRSGPRLASGQPEKVPGLALEISGSNIALDDDLRKALRPIPSLLKAWDSFAPLGRLNFSANIDRPLLPQEPSNNTLEDLDVRVDVRGCSIQPTFFPYSLEELSGQFRYHHNRLELSHLRARHGGSCFALEKGTVELHPGGGYYADLNPIQAQPLLMDTAFLQALPSTLQRPSTLQKAIAALKLQDPINVQTRLIVCGGSEPGSPPDLYWDGQMRLRQAKLWTGVELSDVTGTLACQGRYDGRHLQGLQGNFLLDQARLLKQPFEGVEGKFQVQEKTPDVLLVGLRAPLFGGELAGQVRLDFHSSLRYELNLTASQINLKEFGRYNLGANAQLNGLAGGRLHLTGQGTSADTLDGNGTLDVPSGRLLNLPLLLDLLKFLGLRLPDRTAFEEAHAAFSVHGQRVRVSRLDLLGSAISLSGQGEFNLDGTDLHLDFYPSWARVEQLLPPMVRPLPPALAKHLLKIEMRGKVGRNPGDLRFTKKLMPDLIDPLLSLRDQVRGKAPGAGVREPGPGISGQEETVSGPIRDMKPDKDQKTWLQPQFAPQLP